MHSMKSRNFPRVKAVKEGPWKMVVEIHIHRHRISFKS